MSKGPCLIPDCGRPIRAVGLCKRHYAKRQRGKLPGFVPRPPRPRMAKTLEPTEPLGWNILHYKHLANLSVDAIAANAGLGKGTITNAIYKLPNVRTVYLIAEVLGVEPWLLFQPLDEALKTEHL